MSNFITKEFDACSAAQWKQKIQVDLKGADYNDTLLTATNEGITIKPFYHSDTFEKLEIPPIASDTKICESIVIKTSAEANNFAKTAISRGAQALEFHADQPFEIENLWKGLKDKDIDFHFKLSFLSPAFIDELLQAATSERIFLNLDPIGNLVKTGNWFQSINSDIEQLKEIIQKNPNRFCIGVSADIFQNAGANTVQQIAYSLAQASEYLNIFGGEIANSIQFSFAVGSNYFFEISKLRAFRYLLKRILKVYGADACATIFASPSKRNKTLYDYNVNLLRTTTECMSALLGGANTISNMSYDGIYKDHNDFGKRIARNQLLILKKESYFSKASEIPTNTYYIESITKQLAEHALKLFKEIEKSGGFLHQLKEGTIQRKISENANKEQSQFESGKLVLLGTNKYPNPEDRMKDALEIQPFVKSNPKKTLIEPIIERRLAETLELKRLKDEA